MTNPEDKKKQDKKDEASLKGTELTSDEPLVPSSETQAEAHEGQGDGNPGGGLSRADD